MSSLPSDLLTGGLLSKLLTDAWLDERQGHRRFLKNHELEQLHVLLTNNSSSLFARVPENIYVPPDALNLSYSKGISSSSDLEERYIEFFDDPGFVLYDGTYAAAGGRFRYVYRAKGIRIFWMREGVFRVCSVYATIGDEGFSLAHEEIDICELSFGLPDDLPEISMYASYSEHEEVFGQGGDAHFWVKQLANINQPYNRAYFIEYLVNPPDVQELSDFSINVRQSLWQSIFQFATESLAHGITPEQRDLLTFTFRFMKQIEVDPPLESTLSFTENILGMTEIPKEEIAELMRELRDRLPSEDDIFSNNIFIALQKISEPLARKYTQVKTDIAANNQRSSWSGSAHEIREVLRGLLETLAPDEHVILQNWYRQNQDTNGPTQRQRVRYILQSRGAGSSEARVAEKVEFLEEFGSLVRDTYSRASDAAHGNKDRREVMRIVRYFEAFAYDLLDLD